MIHTKEETYTIMNMSCLVYMDSVEENTFDTIVCDPPYELGFMNKKWDNTGIAFSIETWKKALRVLKPGGFLIAFGHSRLFHRMMVAIEDAGFFIQDTLLWIYGTGFPKAHDLSEQMEGYKTPNIKPAFEPIVMAQKPFKGTFADNILKWGVGGINIDECRIGTSELDKYDLEQRNVSSAKGIQDDNTFLDAIHGKDAKHGVVEQGRFPANIIHDGSKEACSGFPNTKSGDSNGFVGKDTNKVFGKYDKNIIKPENVYADKGSAARYFYTAKASVKDREEGLEEFEDQLFVQSGGGNKALADGKEEYLQENHLGINKIKKRKNIHPCVKPTDLMQYLVRLVAPKGSTVLDIFMGSGSTGKAVMIENTERNADYKFIGVDLEKEYCDIAKARIEWGINFKKLEDTHILYDEKGNTHKVIQEKFDL